MINLQKYSDKIARAVSFLSNKNIKQAQIYIEDSEDFIVAFFAALALDLKPLILSTNNPQEQMYFIKELELADEKSPFCIDKNAKFYLKTSGSSGEAKLIEKSFSQMEKEALALANHFSFADEFLASVTHQHMFGLTFKIFLPLILEAKIEPKFLNYPEFIYEKDLKNKTLITSPTLLKALLESPKKEHLKGLKNVICAGARLEEKLSKELKSLCKCINVYGSTETGVIATDEMSKNGELVAFNGVNISKDENDRLIVSSPWCDEITTGDVVSINTNKITILGRYDRILKINEKRISLDSLETLLLKHEFVNDCICGVCDDKKRISVLLVLSNLGEVKFRNDGKKGVCDALKAHIKAEYQNNVRHFKIVSNIARNTQGKFKKEDFCVAFNMNHKISYDEISLTGQKLIASAYISPWLFYFDGHFIDFPLVPGFVQLECVSELAKKLGVDISHSPKIEAMKFNSFLRPLDRAKFELEIKDKKLYFNVDNGTKICASGRICIN